MATRSARLRGGSYVRPGQCAVGHHDHWGDGDWERLLHGAGWVGNSYFQGGGTAWQNGQTVMTDAGLASPYWGYEVQCVAAPAAAPAAFTHFHLADRERDSRPEPHPGGIRQPLVPDPSRGMGLEPPGDPWPLQLAASDPSGVCSMSASIGDHQLPGPSAVPHTSQWQQCPDPTWTPMWRQRRHSRISSR